MKVIGLTGGIGMGKSTAASAFRRAGIPVFDADASVHRLQAPGGRALRAIGLAFPGTVRDGVLDRSRLREVALGDLAALTRLENILHPMVRAEERSFLARARRAGRRLAVLDVPLLFESDGHRQVDAVVVVTAGADVREVADRLIDSRRLSVVVVDDDDRPLGRILADDVLDAVISGHRRWQRPRAR